MKEKILFFLHLIITVASSIMYVITMKQKAAAIREYNSLSQWQRLPMSVNPYNPDYTVYFFNCCYCFFHILYVVSGFYDKRKKG